ncbi:MAG TPA: heme-binding protein [Caulobacteraceae bacterium]
MPKPMIRPISVALMAGAVLMPIPALAQGLLPSPRINAALANEAVGAAVAACAAQGYAETAVLVDIDGVVQASLRGDNAGIHTLDSAHDKAYTSVTFKSDTTPMLDRAQALNALVTRLPHMLLAGGGVVIKSGQTVVGAIGAAGAPGFQFDDACAKAGAQKIADRLK